ncbi:uncharacterized protein [Atheta coriaria]|uniref:uncharacterized protein n=1 Tax=Dalotia coriaria TaxID=877792 RepID=UPI0031F373DE
MAPPNDDALSLKSVKIGVRLLLLVQLSMCLMVEIKGLNADYQNLRNADGIIKANHIQPLDNEENPDVNKDNIPLTAEINTLNRVGVDTSYDNFALNEIRQASPVANSQEGQRPPQEKNTRNIKNNPGAGTSADGVCHMDIEYKLTKRVLGRCTNLGRTTRGCMAGNYLQIYHSACF